MIKCPECRCEDNEVTDSRYTSMYGGSKRRLRKCLNCGVNTPTYEVSKVHLLALKEIFDEGVEFFKKGEK